MSEANTQGTSRMTDLSLRRACPADLPTLALCYQASRELHQPFTDSPDWQNYSLEQRYLLCKTNDNTQTEIVGTFQLSGIIRGKFHSAYLGFEAFMPHQRQGLMRQGLPLLIAQAFGSLGLHRLEANIQPTNIASIALARGAGFLQEGYSPAYLYIDGAWRDHQRWALLNPHWQPGDTAQR